ncbi:MAG: hypothetical protein JWM20_236 [Patescibacteria group bacterium]|nr:hypothetical protein [Patescibacteria group bacterium]
MKKQITSVKAFKKKQYYACIYYSPQGTPSNPEYFFIIGISKENMVTTMNSKGIQEDFELSKLKKFLSYDHLAYFNSNKKAFSKSLKETISEKEDQIKSEQEKIDILNKFLKELL